MGMKTERAASDFFFEESVLYFYWSKYAFDSFCLLLQI